MKKLSGWIDMDLEKIRGLMSDGVSFQEIARIEGMPVSVLYRIRDGMHVKRFSQHGKNREKQEEFCTICKRNPLPKGHRYFCRECFRTVGSGEISPELKLNL